jgi:predicted DNA-binding protein (MmcQ/YjbR family)
LIPFALTVWPSRAPPKTCNGATIFAFKVGGKIFAIVSLDNPRLCFKCAPETFAELIEREDIHPAPYVGRYKWVMLDRLDAVPWDELRELIRQSYEMVAAKAPARTAGEKKSVSKGAHPKKTKRP